MENLVVMHRSELDRLLKEAVREALDLRAPVKERMNIDEAVAYLNENGVPITKSTVYKHTMSKTIPFKRFGDRRIVFSVKDLDEWVDAQLARRQNRVIEHVKNSAMGKMA